MWVGFGVAVCIGAGLSSISRTGSGVCDGDADGVCVGAGVWVALGAADGLTVEVGLTVGAAEGFAVALGFLPPGSVIPFAPVVMFDVS